MNASDKPFAIYDRKNILIFYFLVISLVYSPVILFNYAFSDDWYTLSLGALRAVTILDWDVQSGRPLNGIARYLSNMAVHNVNDLVYLRLFSVISIFALCYYLFSFIDKRNVFTDFITKLAFPLLICLIPAIQVYSAWASCFTYPLSILLSGISYSILNPVEKKTTVARFFLAISILWMAFALYQPSAMSFLFFVFLDNCIKQDKTPSIAKLIINAGVMFFGICGSFVMSKLVPAWVYGIDFFRSTITNNVYEKINWFICDPLINAINNFNIYPANTAFTVISAFLLIAGMIKVGNGKSGLAKILIFIFLCVGSYLPSLVISETWAPFRSLIALELFTCTMIIVGIVTIAKKLNNTKIIMPVFVCIAMNSASYNILNGFIFPQRSELSSLAAVLSQTVSKNFTGTVMFDIRDPIDFVFSDVKRYDEFGAVTSSMTWSLKGMAEHIRDSKHMHFKLADTAHDVIFTSKNQCITDCIVIKTSDALKASTPNF